MAIYNVSSLAELYAALSNAAGGDEIWLASGDYGELQLRSSAQFSSEVTITSADPANPASFSSMNLNGAENITFDGLNFDYTYASGDSSSWEPFKILNSSNITLRNGVVSGDNDDSGYPTARGISVRDSSGVVIDNMEVSGFHIGIKTYQSQNITLTNSDIHNISGDGIKISSTQGFLIENNYIHDFNADPASATHRDMIQVFTMGNDIPNTDLIIRSNTFDVGDGAWTQTIFMRNEEVDQGRAGQEMFHQNIVIENNVIYNAHTHGITVGETDGLVIRNNTVIGVETNQDLLVNQDRKSGVLTPQIAVSENSTSVTIENNVVAGIRTETQSGWNVDVNVFIQNTNPGASGYYDDVFIYYATSGNDGYNQYGVKPGSIIDQLNAGSTLVDSYPTPLGAPAPEEPAPEPAPEEPAPEPAPEEPAPEEPAPEPDDKAFLDSFDDFVLDISAGLNDNDQVSKVEGDAHVVFDGSGYAIVFDGDGDYVNLGRLTEFEQSEQIAFTVEFTRNEADGSHQRLIWNHQKIGLELVGDGLVVKVANKGAAFHKGFSVDNIGLNNTETHRFTVLVDQNIDRLQVFVDDMLVLDETGTDFDFVDAGGKEWGWMLGSPWGRDVDGTVTDFRIDNDVTFIGDQVPIDDASFLG